MRYLIPSLAILLLVVLLPRLKDNKNENNIIKKRYETRIKGENQTPKADNYLQIYRKNQRKIDLLKNKSIAHEGDLIQLSYYAKNKYGMIISIDGNLHITRHFPGYESQSLVLTNNKKIMLPIAYMLDEAPKYEIFLFITSNKKINQAKIISVIKKQLFKMNTSKKLNLNLPKSFKIYKFVLIKR